MCKLYIAGNIFANNKLLVKKYLAQCQGFVYDAVSYL
nr:MAG TPA: hypothetical protein [Caudoviricetes sp.]